MLKKYLLGIIVMLAGAFLVGCQMNTSADMVATTTCCKSYTTQQNTQVKSCTSCSQYADYQRTSTCVNSRYHSCNRPATATVVNTCSGGTSCNRAAVNTCSGRTYCNTQYSCPNDHGDYSTDNIGYYGDNQDCYYDQCNRYRCYNY